MSSKKNGGPAFPRPYGNNGVNADNPRYSEPSKGMTLRDWFAGQALIALAIGDRDQMAACSRDSGDELHEIHASWSYQQADAMLLERDKENTDVQ